MKIMGFDYPCMDMNIFCSDIPGEDQLTELMDASLMGGGKVPNAVMAAARLGAETMFVGAVGSDRYGRLCRQDLADQGTDVKYLLEKPGHTALCLSIVDEETHGKHFIESKPTFEKLSEQETEEISRYLSRHTKPGDYLMLYQMDESARSFARAVRNAGGLVEVDGDEYDERTQASLPLVDVFILSEYYYRHVFPEKDALEEKSLEANLKKLSLRGPKVVVVTLGSEGCAGVDHGEYFRAGACRVEAKDTTGAGDVFHGAFVYALGTGKRGKEAALFAGAVSAIKCTILGGRTGIPTLACTEHFIATGEILPADFKEREEKYRNSVWEERVCVR